GPNGLVLANDGNLYGTTLVGGMKNAGTVFKVTTTGTFTKLYDFCSVFICSDGRAPEGELIQASDGNLYGTTASGGNNTSEGTVFKISLSGVLSVVYNFCSKPLCADGSNPNAGLLQGTNGMFYGTTATGGNTSNLCLGAVRSNCGTIFQLSSSGKLTTLY